MEILLLILNVFIISLLVWGLSGLLGLIIISKRVYGKYFDAFKDACLHGGLAVILSYAVFGMVLLKFSLNPNLKEKVEESSKKEEKE